MLYLFGRLQTLFLKAAPFQAANNSLFGDSAESVATFLASEDSAYLTGSTLSPTGGLTFH